MNRRKFVKQSIGLATGAAAMSSMPLPLRAAKKGTTGMIPLERMFVGTPVLPGYLYEHGIADVLDEMREVSGINTVMTFSHDHVFRQYRPEFGPKLDEAGREITEVWVKTNPKYYADPRLQGRNPGSKYDDRDLLDELQQEAASREMQVFARILEPYVVTGVFPGWDQWVEVNALGDKTDQVCYNHPDYIAYWDAVVRDLIETHPQLHGFKFGQERGGPILASLGKKRPGKCFCEHCLKLAKARGLDAEEARRGHIELHEFGDFIRSGQRPVDGNFVEFFRILTRNPDVLAWEQFWMDSREAQRKRMYSLIKSIRPSVQVGWHIDHGMTWDLITRATWDYRSMGPHSDWLSIGLYFDSMGRRSMGHYDRNYRDILFGDADEQYSYPMYLSMLGFDPSEQPPLSAHREQDTAFSPQYVYDECDRVVKQVNGSAKVYARPGFDMPGYDCNVQPKEVKEAVRLALKAQVDGFWVGREWDELTRKNALAFGDALRDHVKG